MKKFSLIPLALAFLLLAGCSTSKTSPLSDDITKKALSLKDKTICEALKVESEKSVCISSVSDSMTVDAAVASGDMGACNTIQNSDYKRACVIAATSRQRTQEKEKAEKDKLNTAQNGTSLEACNSLEEPSAKEQCIVNVSSSTAYAQKKPELCNPIKNPTVKEICVAQAKE